MEKKYIWIVSVTSYCTLKHNYIAFEDEAEAYDYCAKVDEDSLFAEVHKVELKEKAR